MAKHGLGSGLDVLFAENGSDDKDVITMVDISSVTADENQYRKTFDEDSIKELADSISVHGVISPLIVRPYGNGYKIIAGERRYRASKLAGLAEIPVIIKEVSDKDAAEISLIENLQREDLNPVEEARGLEKLISDFGLTQEEAAKRVGKSRSALTNALRLLTLPESALSLLKGGMISPGHARALLPLNGMPEQEALIRDIIDDSLSVRDVEKAVRSVLEGSVIASGSGKTVKDAEKDSDAENSVYVEYLRTVGERAGVTLGRSVKIQPTKKGAGRITIEFYDNEDLEELLTSLGAEDSFKN